jgi:hypothetical protein
MKGTVARSGAPGARRRRNWRAALGFGGPALALGAFLALPAQAPAQEATVINGVTTHLSQGWPPRLLSSAQELGVTMIRDSVHWPQVEKAPGQYQFTPANSAHVDRACAAGIKVLLGEEPRNPLYDGGQTAFTPAAQAAYARFLKAAADRWPGCVTAIEIGNEINGKGGMTGPAAQDRIAAHVALLRAVHQAVKPGHPGLALLGGSVNTVAGGFLARLIKAGALQWVDGLAVHPYRPDPEGVDTEVARLNAAIRAAGASTPVWATEFSRAFVRPGDGAGHYLKMAALLESAGVTRHLWYALADQPGFPTMGLVRFDGAIKPAGQAFRLAASQLEKNGPARRIDEGDPALFHFRYGATAHVIWGAPRSFRADGPGVRILSATGAPVSSGEIGDQPLVVLGAANITFGPRRILADSLLGYGAAPLEWAVRDPGGALTPLRPVDWQWTSYLGAAAIPGALVIPRAIGTVPGGTMMVRYQARAAGDLFASACLVRQGGNGPAHLALTVDGRPQWEITDTSSPSQETPHEVRVRIAARPGSVIALEMSSPAPASIRYRYRLRIALDPANSASCPEKIPQ